MGCSGSRSADASNPASTALVVEPLTKKPEFPPGCKSMVCKYLTDEVFNQLKDVKDKHGYTLAELINSGVKNPNSSIGLYAGSPETYVKFFFTFRRISLHFLNLVSICSSLGQGHWRISWT